MDQRSAFRETIEQLEVFVAYATTESGDNYFRTFSYRPSRTEVIRMVFEEEGGEDFDNYMDTVCVEVFSSRLIVKKDNS